MYTNTSTVQLKNSPQFGECSRQSCMLIVIYFKCEDIINKDLFNRMFVVIITDALISGIAYKVLHFWERYRVNTSNINTLKLA